MPREIPDKKEIIYIAGKPLENRESDFGEDTDDMIMLANFGFGIDKVDLSSIPVVENKTNYVNSVLMSKQN